MELFWREIFQTIKSSYHIVVATIVSHSGSTPRTSGSKMLISPDGHITGTIGGGQIEADVIRCATALFLTKRSVIKSYNLTASSGVAGLDLICGGRMRVLLEYIARDDTTIAIYSRLREMGEVGKSAVLLGKLVKRHGNEYLEVKRSVKVENGTWTGPLQISSEMLHYLKSLGSEKSGTSMFEMGGHHFVIDICAPQKTVFIIGAGHVAKEIAHLARRAIYRTVVIDDRAEFANSERFPDADRVLVCSDYSKPLTGFEIDENYYIIIVTRGHGFDKEALAQALTTEATYIGMIGSRKKRDSIYSSLLEEGIDANQLERVHCPIGLSIDAETPFEIAVSIIAELIHYRANTHTGLKVPG